MMKRCAFFTILVAGIGIVRPVQAAYDESESDGSVTCEVTKLDGEDFYESDSIGRDDCKNAKLTFVVRGPATQTYEAYIEDESTCSRSNKEGCVRIEGTENEIPSDGEDTFEKSVTELLNYYGGSCDDMIEKTVRVYIFRGDETTGAACTPLKIDTLGPAVPTNVEAGSGEHEINIDWEMNDDDDDDVKEYKVYYKVVKDCEQAIEDAVETAVSVMESLASDAGTDDTDDSDSELPTADEYFDDYKTSTDKDYTLEVTDIAKPGEELIIAVVAIDEGGNSSLPSEAACARVVPTRGFCDSTDKCEDGCSVGPIGKDRANTTAGIVVGLLTLFALVWARRRSRT